MKEVKLTRQELYDLVWTESMLSLSKKYAISDVGLRKKCKALEIPLPNVGYWAKVQFGKKVLKRRQLGVFDGAQTVTLYLRDESDVTKESRSELLKQIQADDSLNLKVPEKLSNPDKLILLAKDDLLKSKVWKKNEGIVYHSLGKLNINVSPKNIDRALRFMDTLIKALRQRGHDFKIAEGTHVVVYGEKFIVCCREKLSKVLIKGNYSEYNEYQASGLLALSVEADYNTREWVDGKSTLEEKLATIIVYLEMKGRQLRNERIEREKRREELREQERKEKEIQDHKEKEFEDFKELFRKAKRHDNAEKLRRYAQELEQNSTARNMLTDELRDKIDWIRKKADWYDPFVEAEDELMRGIDREELKMEKRTFYWLNK